MFVSLFQRNVLDFSSLLNGRSKPFGEEAGSNEGPKLVIKLKQLWKQQLSLKTKEQSLAAKAGKQRLEATGFHSSIDFSSTTETPQSNKNAAAKSVQKQRSPLPDTKTNFYNLLKTPKTRKEFGKTLENAFSHQPQSAFRSHFGEQIDTRIVLTIDQDEKKRFSIATQQCLPPLEDIDKVLQRNKEVAKNEIIQSLIAATQPR